MLLQAVNWLIQGLQLAILIRVLYSWVDPNPYPTNELKRILWAVTDPVLEPLRRIVLLQVVQQVLFRVVLQPY